MAGELQIAFDVAERSLKDHERSSTRIWFPRISMAWLGLPLRSVVTEEPIFNDDELG